MIVQLFLDVPDLQGALCAQTDPELFYPGHGQGGNVAKKLCRACPVRADCLQYALDHDEAHGIWGGLGPRARKRLKKQQDAATDEAA